MTGRPEDRQLPARASLLEFFDAYVRGATEGVVHDDGFRTYSYTLGQLGNAAELLQAG